MAGSARKSVARTGFTAANDATDLNQVGTVMDGQSKQYRYVRVEDLALAANDVVEYADATGMEVSQDRAGGSSLGRHFAGVALNTVTDAYYTWVQVKGVATCFVAALNAAVAAGARVAPHSTENGGVITATTSTFHQAFGTALAADTATTTADGTVSVMIDL